MVKEQTCVVALARRSCLVCNRSLELRDEFPNPETLAMESKNGEIGEFYKIEKWDPENRIYENPKITKLKSWNRNCRNVKL